MSIELCRYQGVARDGGTSGNMSVEKDEQNVPTTVTKEKAAEIAAEFISTNELTHSEQFALALISR
jgi:hypothetical protein